MNLTREDLQAISDLMDKKLDEKLQPIKEDISILKEDVEIVKGAMEEVLEWFDTYQRNDLDKPFPANEKNVV